MLLHGFFCGVLFKMINFAVLNWCCLCLALAERGNEKGIG